MLIAALTVSVLLASALAGATETDPPEPGPEPADSASPAFQSGFEGESSFGGPESVPNELEEQDRVIETVYRLPVISDAMQPWFDLKRRVNDATGLAIGLDYSVLYQWASRTLTGEDQAASGLFRAYGKWTLFDRGGKFPGALVVKGENRIKLGTELAPSSLGGHIGYLGITGTTYSDVDWVVTNLYWEQVFSEQNAGFAVGHVDSTDFIDILGYANPWTGFQNLSVIMNTTIPFPDPGLGGVVSARILDHWSIVAGVYDANGSITKFGSLEGDGELFKHLELGWSPSAEERFYKRIHVVGWHVDEREHVAVPESWGLALSASWVFFDNLVTFVRGGWSKGEAPILNAGVTAGVGYYFRSRADVLAIGASWGRPALDLLRDQYSIEAFYRFQVTQNFAITPSAQLLVDPALNPKDDTIWILGLRARLTL